jgi:hypothetical protein
MLGPHTYLGALQTLRDISDKAFVAHTTNSSKAGPQVSDHS